MRLAKLGKYKGQDNPFFGKKHTKETIEKIKATKLKNKHLKSLEHGKATNFTISPEGIS